MPHISVIMPTYNCAAYLREAIESILNQTYIDFEFIIVNEPGSPDDTDAIIAEYAERDRRIIYIQNEKRLGICPSLNIGLKQSSGEFWARMDADDISGPRRLEVQSLYMDLFSTIGAFGVKHAVVGSKTWVVDYFSDPEVVKAMALFYVPLRHPTIMARRAWTFQYDLFYDESMPGAEDVDIQQRMSLKFQMSNINDPSLFLYRVHPANTAALFSERDFQLRKVSMKKHFLRSLKLSFNDYDIDILLIRDGIMKYKGQKQIEGYLRLEHLMKKIHEKNLDVKCFDPKALALVLYHLWQKQMVLLVNKFSKKLPPEIPLIYKNSSFYKRPGRHATRKSQICE